ncbi:pyruvate dehydrogenase protein X component, mitochondrial-like isoform X2 [Liolophura sinensis]
MPSLSPTMTEGVIKKWIKQEGEEVKAGDVLLVMETDKADMEMEADEDGVLAKILVPAGTGAQIPVGQLIGVLAEEGEDWKSVEIPEVTATQSPSSSESSSSVTPAAQTGASATASQSGQTSSSYGPSVRKLLEEFGIKSSDIQPSGPHGRIVKGDVLQHIKSKALNKVALDSPAPGGPSSQAASPLPSSSLSPASKPALKPGETYVDIPHSNMRKTIAKRLTQSKSGVPHTYASISCDMGKISRLRKQLKKEDVKVSVNDFIIKAAAIGLQRNPRVNSVWQGDNAQSSNTVDISVAVATENGLITPIVKNAPFLGVDDISNTVKEMAGRARIGKLKPHEYQGGSFSISNLGMFGIQEFTAVINPPQCAILAVGATRPELGLDGQPQALMTVQLSYDGRVIDHTEASQFLETFKALIETPSLMVSGFVASGL